ncbi:glycoside hydrolase family 16 protein [Plantactinospora sp. CA-290183]|uniref:glycoside hydrolase family 16 protein n=1 Tax=Plantactinospora sp. CA-290183 TaxID=3240006 RepID=UPI003D8D7A02
MALTLAAVAYAPAAASAAAAPNTCPSDIGQWGPLRGGQAAPGTDYYRQAATGSTEQSFYLPQQAVSGGQQWSFQFDATVEATAGATARARVEVDWYSTPAGNNSGFLGHVDGPWITVPVGAGASTTLRHTVTAPAGAVRANVLSDVEASAPANTWTGRGCDYRLLSGDDGGDPPPPTGEGDTAAARFGWGTPLAAGSDEFNYGSASSPAVPDQAKWSLAGGSPNQCWPGHSDNGRRCDKNTRVVGGVLRQTGETNGDSGWLASNFGQRYGRWEARVRSQATSANNGRQYHPLLILWPDSDRWPQDGEYDYLENSAPGEQCVEAFIHYPHNANAPVQQEFAQRCGVDQTQWHNIAVEWTPNHVRGFVDGVQWFSFSGGANSVRQCIQCAPSMHQTIQLDNFFGSGMQSAIYEIDWTRVYAIPGVST